MLPILELTRDFFGIVAHDAPAEARRKVAGTLALLDDGFRSDLPLAFDFLQIGDADHPTPTLGPQAHQRRLVSFLKQLTEKRSAQQPAVLFIDDLHWIDPGSDAFLAHFVEAVGTTRTLLLLNFRPEYQAQWMNRSDYRRIPVLPLGDAAIEEMLGNLLGSDPSVGDLRTRIHDRTKGNPFFAEELVLALAGSGALEGQPGAYRLVRPADESAIPPTVQGILAARIDRLDGGDKRVLHAAAVIGREFDAPTLARLLRTTDSELTAALDALRRAELIYETAIYPVAEYVFKHPLTQEVAYGSQLQETRARTHALVADTLIELAAERADERAALIAHHFEAAGDGVSSAGWHARAARTSSFRDANATADHWRRVRTLLATVETPEALRLRAEACREILFTTWRTGGVDEAEWQAVYDEGTVLAQRTDDKHTLAMVISAMAGKRGFAGEHRVQIEMLEEALRVATAAGDFALQASMHQRIGWSWELAGDNRKALEWTERGIQFCERDRSQAGRTSGWDTLAWLHAQRGWGLIWAARFAEGEREFERAEALAIVADDEFTRTYIRSGRFNSAWRTLDRQGIARWGAPEKRDRERGAAYGFTLMQGWACMEAGDWNGAVEAFETAVSLWAVMGAVRLVVFHINASASLAIALAALGDLERARHIVDDIRCDLAANPELRATPLTKVEVVRALLAVHGSAASSEIAALIEELLRAAREYGYATAEPFALQYRAELARLLGDDIASARDLRAAVERFRQLDCDARADALEQQWRTSGGQL
jgi:adenylate cyclase